MAASTEHAPGTGRGSSLVHRPLPTRQRGPGQCRVHRTHALGGGLQLSVACANTHPHAPPSRVTASPSLPRGTPYCWYGGSIVKRQGRHRTGTQEAAARRVSRQSAQAWDANGFPSHDPKQAMPWTMFYTPPRRCRATRNALSDFLHVGFTFCLSDSIFWTCFLF